MSTDGEGGKEGQKQRKSLTELNVSQEIVLLRNINVTLPFLSCISAYEQWPSRASGSTQVGSSCVIVDAKERGDLMKPSMEAAIEEECHVSALFIYSCL